MILPVVLTRRVPICLYWGPGGNYTQAQRRQALESMTAIQFQVGETVSQYHSLRWYHANAPLEGPSSSPCTPRFVSAASLLRPVAILLWAAFCAVLKLAYRNPFDQLPGCFDNFQRDHAVSVHTASVSGDSPPTTVCSCVAAGRAGGL